VSLIDEQHYEGDSVSNLDVTGSDRLIVIWYFEETDANTQQLSSVTVDGKAATFVDLESETSSIGAQAELWCVDETTLGSSTGIVTVSAVGEVEDSFVQAFAFEDTASDCAAFSGNAYNAQSEGAGQDNNQVYTLDIPAGGAVALGTMASGGSTNSWEINQGATEAMDELSTGNDMNAGAAYELVAAAETGTSYTHTYDNGNRRKAGIAIAIAPAAVGEGDLTGSIKIIDSNSTCVSDCDGSTLAKAWDSLDDITGLVTGDDIGLVAGSVFEDERFVPGSSFKGTGSAGVPTDAARVGTVYVDTGDGNILVWYNEGTGSGRGAKAEINGTYDDTCRNISNTSSNTDTCLFGVSGAVPQSTTQGLVQIDGEYVHFTDIVMRDSAGRGVQINEKEGFRFLRSEQYDIRGTFAHGGGSGSTYQVWDESTFARGGYGASGHYESNGGSNLACFTFARGSHEDRNGANYGLFTNNLVYDGKCELFSLLQTSGWIIRANRIYSGADAVYYVDNSSTNVIEWNIFGFLTDACVVARKNNTNCPTGETSVKLEQYTNSSDNDNNLTRHNAFLYGGEFNHGGIEVGVSPTITQGKYFVHNTLVDMGFRDRNSSSTFQAGMTAENNAFVGSGSFSCVDSVMESNAFEVTQGSLDNDCEGTNDNYGVSYTFAGGAPEQESFANHTDWSFANLTITAGAANNDATDLSTTNVSFIGSTCTNDFPQLAWANFTSSIGTVNFAFNCANWRKLGYYNYLGNARSSANDKGF
ncbi:MAG: hypothetical protein AAF993_16215, partial [Pseudomonadota bacterium]